MTKWNSAQDFLNSTIGRSYDMDAWPKYQPFQCWDYGDYFWTNQVGRALITKAGGMASVRDCWTVSRFINAGNDFELITDKNILRVGDWCIFNAGGDGHIGIVKSIVKTGVSVMLQGENQGATYVTVINRSLADFLGAFRLKAWNKTTPKPSKKSVDTIAKEVIKGLWGNGDERRKKLTSAGYDYATIQNRVNEMLAPKPSKKKSVDTIAKEVIKGLWGNGDERKKKLTSAGYDYATIQKRVNEMLK